MEATEVTGWLRLLEGGGDVALIVAAVTLTQLLRYLRELLVNIQTKIEMAHDDLKEGQEEIKRAMVALDPKIAPIFSRASTRDPRRPL